MGLPMRYPRPLIVLLVALGLAALPATNARAANTAALPDSLERIETMAEIAGHASDGADLVLRDGVVALLAEQTGFDHEQSGRLLDAILGLADGVTNAAGRAGVLASPEIETLFDALLSVAGAIDPQAEQMPAVDVYPTNGAIAAAAEARTLEAAGPIERWRPLVEQYFPADRVEEALSIIECESNGDPGAKNPRSSASGLFQFISRTWDDASKRAGFADASPFEPEANVAAAAWLVGYSLEAGNSAWAPWSCRP